MRPSELTLAAAAELIRERRLSPVELVESVLDRIEETEPKLGAYALVTADRAREEAHRAAQEIASGRLRGPLHGIPMALKDLIDVAGLPTTASSRVRIAAGHRATEDSTVTARLAAAGAVLLGKAHTHEFAYGVLTPQTRNARDPERIAGGSSGGSAVAVAAGSATFSLGTDTGGSIRIPAALNGIVGLKPTYGLVPTEGIVPLSWSLDHVGPLTRTVEDAGLVLAALTGEPPEPAETRRGLDGLRVGVPRDHRTERVHPEVAAAVRRAIDRLRELGARTVDIDIPMAGQLIPTHQGLTLPEATAFHEETLRTTPELYGDDVRTLLETGALVPAIGHLRAQRVRTLIRAAWSRLLREVDVIAAPTVPITAVPAGAETVHWPDGTQESVTQVYVRLAVAANITGFPALSLPVGRDRDGLPIGLQLMGRPREESLLLAVGTAYETAGPGA
ncbi:amidase [Streptomyces sp. NPDC000594]|uniref:amidase n=1 Tax=Streptomyces sp. NPDC000594 TaxID=3154261 RepID=UPI00332FCA3F